MNLNVEERVTQLIGSEAEYIMGFADLSGLLPEIYGHHTFGIVIGKKLDNRIVDSVATGPNLEYMQHYRQINRELSTLVHRISAELKAMKISTIVIEPTVNDDELDDQYYKTLRTDFSHKMAATLAGLGWIGKTALLISKKFVKSILNFSKRISVSERSSLPSSALASLSCSISLSRRSVRCLEIKSLIK